MRILKQDLAIMKHGPGTNWIVI